MNTKFSHEDIVYFRVNFALKGMIIAIVDFGKESYSYLVSWNDGSQGQYREAELVTIEERDALKFTENDE